MTKHRIIASLALLALPFALPAQAGVDVGVSINLAAPGVFGRIELGGNEPPPQLVYAQPVLVAPPAYAPPPPVYLYVPPDHQRDWRHHCREYNACGVPVYFVREDWYHRDYEPRYARREWQEGHGRHYGEERHEERREEFRGDRREERGEGYREGRREEHREENRDHDH